MSDREAAAEIVVATDAQLVGDHLHLRRLQASVQRTMLVIQRGAIAYVQSRQLLDRIDGAPHARLRSDIYIPE